MTSLYHPTLTRRSTAKFVLGFCLFLGFTLCSDTSFARTRAFDWSETPPEIKSDLVIKFPSLNTGYPTLEDIDKAIRYLMTSGNFEEVQVLDTGSSLRLDYRVLKKISRIYFEGLKSFSSDEILIIMQMDQGYHFDSRILNDASDRIRLFYVDQGFRMATVQIEVKPVSATLVDLVVTLREGPPVRVKNLTLIAKNKELEGLLQRMLRRNRGKIFNSTLVSDMQTSIRTYLRNRNYIRAQVSPPKIELDETRTSIDLTFVIDRTEQYSVLFQGNVVTPSPRLLSTLDLHTLSPETPNVLPELTARLKDLYLRRGHARIEIQGEEKILKENKSAQLIFQISEGSPIKIENIEILGNLSAPEKFYRDFLIDHSGEVIGKGLFHRADFEQGIKNLLIERQNSGFLKARLISSRYLYNKTKDRITISVNLDEGPLTQIRQIQFQGADDFSPEELEKTLGLKENQPLQLNVLEQGIQQLKSYAYEKGFLEFRILNEKDDLVQYLDDNTRANLNFQIEQGPLVKVNSILVDGNTLTKEYVIRKEVDFKEGDILTPSKIQESTRRLQRLSLFNSVDIRTLEQRTQISNRTVIIKVSERLPGLFNVGAGVTNEREFTLRGFAGIAYRNIDGTARAVSTRADINYNVADLRFPEMRLTAGYLEPYLLDSRTKGRVNFTRAIQVDSYESRRGTDSYQLDFILEQNLTSNILFTYNLWSISQLRGFNIEKDLEFSKFGSTQYLLNLGWTGPGLEIDFRDHPFNPTQGTLTRMQMEYSNPFFGSTQSIEYLKATGSFTHYLPLQLSSPMVFANSLRVGDLINLSGKDGVPYDKKGFILGGLTTIRGFEAGTSERFPNDSDLNLAPGETYFLKNRSQFFLIKSELRFPIRGAVGGAVFYDGGMVKVDQIQFKDPYRDAVGFGLRYATPVGPANLELAWKLDADPERGESPFRLHISIGTF